METKVCKKCNIEKDLSCFNKNKQYKDGLKTFCKTCCNIQRNEWVKNNKEKNTATRREYCKKNKDRIKSRVKEYNSREEVKEMLKINREKNRDKINAKRRERREKNKIYIEKVYIPEGFKECAKCKLIKEKGNFHKNKNTKDLLAAYCKDCKKKLDSLYVEKNKEKIALSNKNWANSNKDRVLEYKNIWKKEKRKNDLVYMLSENIRSKILLYFKKNRFIKKENTEKILGCTFEFLKNYLELKFEPWMNWENRGLYNGDFKYGWDIDHIIPISSAKTEEDVIKLNHYTNLQPLCSKINRYIKRDIT